MLNVDEIPNVFCKLELALFLLKILSNIKKNQKYFKGFFANTDFLWHITLSSCGIQL